MSQPNTPDRHIIMLADNKNPAAKLADQTIPLDQDRTKLVLEEETRLAGEWSAHLLDKLYSHPQHYRAPANIPGCHVIGLLNGDLIIDAISTKRPGEMHYTFNRETKMLQKVTGISLRGGWQAPPIHLGDTPGNEKFRLKDRQAIDETMDDVIADVDKSKADASGMQRVRLTFDENNEPVAIARIAEDGTVEKEVNRTTYQSHSVLTLADAKKGQDTDDSDSNATIDLIHPPEDHLEDSDATISLVEDDNMEIDSNATIDHNPSEADTLSNPDLTDDEDWNETYPQSYRSSNLLSKEALEERARREYHERLERVAKRERRFQLRAVGEAAMMAAEAVMASFGGDSEGVGLDGGGNSGEGDVFIGEMWDWGGDGGGDVEMEGWKVTGDLVRNMDGLDVDVDAGHAHTSLGNGNEVPTYLRIQSEIDIQPLNTIESVIQAEFNDTTQTQSQTRIRTQTQTHFSTYQTRTQSQTRSQYTENQLGQIHQIEQAAEVAAQHALNTTTIHENPQRSELRFIEEAAEVAARMAADMHERVLRLERETLVGSARGEVVEQVEVEELESIDGDAEARGMNGVGDSAEELWC